MENIGEGTAMVDKEKFLRSREKIIGINRVRNRIGTLQEKTVHAVLKNYYEEDEDKQEIPIDNFVADIYNGREVIEIQTAQFNRMRNKLACFLENYQVTVVYPVPHIKYLVWVDGDTGEYAPRRKSPVKGSAYFVFPELYKIKPYLLSDNLHIRVVLMDIEEFRLLNKSPKRRKKSAGRYDRLPLELVDEVVIERKEDYLQFIPYSLGDEFISKDFAKEAHISVSLAQVTLNILHHVGAVERVGKKGNSIIYRVSD